MSVLPTPLRRMLKAVKAWWLESVADRLFFPLWLLWQCLRHRRRAVVLCRIGALGDVLCTLPMVVEIQKKYPGGLLVFVTAYHEMVRLARLPVRIYGSRSWHFDPPCLPGLVKVVYSPKTTDECDPKAGAQCHLVDDLADSCGIILTDRQPRLFVSPELIRQMLATHDLAEAVKPGHRLVVINGGHTWPVRMWDAAKWQELVNRLHLAYPHLTIVQTGLTTGPDDPLEQLRNVRLLSNRLTPPELIALIAASHLVISIDSGPVHIAGAVGVPVIGLYGAVKPQFRLPPASPGIGVTADIPCLYCHHQTPRDHWKNGCPNNIRCMKELTMEAVFDTVKSMLAKHS